MDAIQPENPSLPTVHPPPRGMFARIGLIGGIALFVFILLAPPSLPGLDAEIAQRLNTTVDDPRVGEVLRSAHATLALAALVVAWWITEAIPIPVTALLPGFLLPMLHVTGVANGNLRAFSGSVSFAAYANPVIFLFLAGFLLAGGMSKTGLDRRISRAILNRPAVRRSAGRVLLAVILVTGGFSMWVSNTATAAMMLPIAAGILAQLGEKPGQSRLGAALMMGVAWAASLGGVGTLIGTPPNGIAVSILRAHELQDIHFISWLRWGLPVSILGLLVGWAVLMILFRPRFPTGYSLESPREELEPFTVAQGVTLGVFCLAILLWVSQPFWRSILPETIYPLLERIGENEIALLCAVLLFVLPADRHWRPVLDWRDSRYVDWGTLLLFGGGLVLASALFDTGLASWFSTRVTSQFGGAPAWVYLLVVIYLSSFLTELVSNTAMAGMLTPLLLALAPGLGINPIPLCIAAVLASSLAFMLPMGTPPNALLYGTGYFTMGQMARAGVVMNLVSGLIVALVMLALSAVGVLPLTR